MAPALLQDLGHPICLGLGEPPQALEPPEQDPPAPRSLGPKFYYELRVELLLCHRKKLPPFFREPLFV